MFSRLSPQSDIKSILVISLSNLGDVILTCPVIDVLHAFYPLARLTVMTGPKAAGLFVAPSCVNEVMFVDKGLSWLRRIAWLDKIRQTRYDLIVDLRNSFLPYIFSARYRSRPWLPGSPRNIHRRLKHLHTLATVVSVSDQDRIEQTPRCAIAIPAASVETVLRLTGAGRYIVFAPGAADDRKRWPAESFARLAESLSGKNWKIVLTGDNHDVQTGRKISGSVSGDVLDLCGKTSLTETAALLAKAAFAVTNDSGIMHLASYFDVPVAALFGPTDPVLYGPWSRKCVFLKQGESPAAVKPEDVLSVVKNWL